MKWIEIEKERPCGRIPGIETYEEDTLMEKLRGMKERRESAEIVGEKIFTDKRDGVIPGYNIRFDRFDAGLEACDKYGYFKAQEVAKGHSAETESTEVTESVRQ